MSQGGLVVQREVGKWMDGPQFSSASALSFSSKTVVCGHCLCDFPPDNVWNITTAHTAAHLSAESFWWRQCSVRYSLPLSPPPGILISTSQHHFGDNSALTRQTCWTNKPTSKRFNLSQFYPQGPAVQTTWKKKPTFILYIYTVHFNELHHACYVHI